MLDVSRYSSQSEIASAYRRKARDVHPDKGGSHLEFQRIQTAYDEIRGTDSIEQFLQKEDPFSKRFSNGFDGLIEINRIVTDTQIITEKIMFHTDNSVTVEVIDRVSK